MPQSLVELEGVGVRFGATPILIDLDLCIRAGEVVGVAGPNGSGKTTLLSLLATLLRPASGRGTVLGATLGTDEVLGVRPDIGLSGHEPALFPDLTLRENLRFVAAVAGAPQHRADTVLEAVGLAGAAGRRASRSSNGMQRRVDLARLLLLGPRLVLLDEAHAGLDTAAVSIIDEILRRTRATGGSAILVSHDSERLGLQADRTVQLVGGRLA